MRRLPFVLPVILALAFVFPVAVPSAIPTHAQEGTPPPPTLPPGGMLEGTPAETPTLPPTLNDPMLVGIPFGETFDTNWGWQSDGVWIFDPATAFDGGGWYVDGLPREITSTLTYNFPIDLHGTLSVQLVYRQRGKLPGSDLIALDLSLDGGDTWFSIDQQIGLETDWDRHIVDLTDYRGQVVRMRFRVTTGIQLPAETETTESTTPAAVENQEASAESSSPNAGSDNSEGSETSETASIPEGYWLDNLSIQYVVAPPEMAFADHNNPRTTLGLHLVVGAQREPVLELVKQLRKTGRPLGTLKGVSGTEDILNAVKRESPATVIVFRSLETGSGRLEDCPNIANDPTVEAHSWLSKLQPYWRGVNADYYEIMNECQYPASWLVPFTIEAMRIAGSRGQCILMFSFGTGNPEPAVFADLLPAFQFALENPCRPNTYHGVALHAYGVNPAQLVSESGIYLGLRHRLFYAHVLPELPEAIKLPVYLTEAGPGDGRTEFTCQDVTRDVLQYTQQLEYDPYIRGFHLWNIGSLSPWIDFTACLPMIGNALASYYGGQ